MKKILLALLAIALSLSADTYKDTDDSSFVKIMDKRTFPGASYTIPGEGDENATLRAPENVMRSMETNTTLKDFNATNFVITYDENGTRTYSGDMNFSNSGFVREYYKERGSNKKFMGVVNTLNNRSESSQAMQYADRSTSTKSYLTNNFPDSYEANITKRTDELRSFMKSVQAPKKIMKCYAKRQLIPEYKCPIMGMEDGSRVGGMVADNMQATKQYCDNYCVSEPLGCVESKTDFESLYSFTHEKTFAAEDNSTDYMEFDVDIIDVLKVKKLKMEVTVEYVEQNTTDGNTTYAFKPSTLPLAVDYTISYLENNVSKTIVNDYPSAITGEFSTIAFSSIPETTKVTIRISAPYMKPGNGWDDRSITEAVKNVTISNVSVEYQDNKYYFCSVDQVVLDPQTECKGGEIFLVDGASGYFKICKKDGIIQGPEPRYGAFYTKEGCESSCKYRMECVQTYEKYTLSDLTSDNLFRVEVGCIDDPTNTSCSVNDCYDYFREHKMPYAESVFSPSKGSIDTVVSGAEVPGRRRPKVDIDAENAAADGTGSYENVFLESMKDQAYDNMLKSGTYNYVATPVSNSTPFENAFYRNKIISPNPIVPTKIELKWLLKPRSVEVGDGKTYYFYIIMMQEAIFLPISGIYTKADGQTTANPDEYYRYKDVVYAARKSDGTFDPFFFQGYMYKQEQNETSYNWELNLQSKDKQSFIEYDDVNDTYLAGSDTAPTPYSFTRQFTGAQNWETFSTTSDITSSVLNTKGLVFTAQEIDPTSQDAYPVKKWAVIDENTTAMAGMTRFFGVYSDTALNNTEIMDLIAPYSQETSYEFREPIGDYMFYDTGKYKSMNSVIKGDGRIDSSKIDIFVKGVPDKLTASAHLKPSLEEEGKEAVLFMFLYEEN